MSINLLKHDGSFQCYGNIAYPSNQKHSISPLNNRYLFRLSEEVILPRPHEVSVKTVTEHCTVYRLSRFLFLTRLS